MSCDIAFDAAVSSKVAYEGMFSRPPRIFSLLNVPLTRTSYILSRRISVVQRCAGVRTRLPAPKSKKA